MADFSDGKLYIQASGLPGPAAVNAALAIAAMARAAASAGCSASGVARAAELAARALAEVCPGGTSPPATSSTDDSVDGESAVGPSPAPSSSEEDSGCLDVPELARAWAARGITHALGPLRGAAAAAVDKLGPIGVAPPLAPSTNASCITPPGVRASASAVRPCPAHVDRSVVEDPLSRVAIAGEVTPLSRPSSRPQLLLCGLVLRTCSRLGLRPCPATFHPPSSTRSLLSFAGLSHPQGPIRSADPSWG
jgi:hypothetical protein